MTELFWVCPHCETRVTVKENQDYAPTIGEHLATCPKRPKQTIPNITDIVDRETLEGNVILMDDIIDQRILVKDFSLKDLSFKEDTLSLSLQIELDGEDYMLNTGAERVVQVFKTIAHDQLPFYLTFEKVHTSAGRRVYRIKV